MKTHGTRDAGGLMDSKNFAIGILSTTAVILLIGVLLLSTRSEPAWASGMTSEGGGYILTVGTDPSEDEELVYVIDAPSEKLIVYRFNAGRGRIDIVQGIDLAELTAGQNPPAQPSGPKPGYGRRRRP
jgi:hypothetical protein